MRLDVAVCVITWNSADCIERCLDALFAQTVAPAQVVVVDNASSDETLDRVSRFGSRILLIRNERNLGFAAAANQAYRVTSAPLFATLNPDVTLDEGFLLEITRALGEHPEYGMASGRLVRALDESEDESGEEVLDSTGIELGADRRGRDRAEGPETLREGEVFATCGAAGVWRRDLLERIAYPGREVFDEQFFAYKEDVDVGWRASKLGKAAWYVPQARAVHARGWKVGDRRAIPLWIRVHSLKNRYLMIVKNESGFGLLRNSLPILWFELRAFVYLLLFEPGLWRVYPAMLRNLPQAWRKRRWFARRLRQLGIEGREGEAAPERKNEVKSLVL